MVSITSDSPHIKRAFENLIETLESAGSGFHSNLCIDASTTGICLTTKEPMLKGKEIIRIPRSALMPGDQYVVKLIGDHLEIDYFVHSTLKERQKTIISQMFEIYNLTAKVQEHKKICFLLSLKDYPTLYEKLMANREYNPKYDKWFKGLQEGMDENSYKRFMIDTFIQTRPLGYSDPIREDSMTTIMPVIDFLNHHWDGANFNVAGGARVGDLTISTSQPFDGNTECFAFYGVLDPADSLIRYNFVDRSCNIVRSISLELDLPDGRKIIVGNKGHDPAKRGALPEALSDLTYYAPNLSLIEEEGKDEREQNLKASFLIIANPESGAPQALRRVLGYAIHYMYGKQGEEPPFNATEWVAETENKIVEINKEHYEDIKTHVQDLIKEKGSSEHLSRIEELADVQLGHLERYLEFSQKQKIPATATIKKKNTA